MDHGCGVEPLDEATEIVAEEIRALVLRGERAGPVESAPRDRTAKCVRVCMDRIRECAGRTCPNAASLGTFARRPAVVGATRQGVHFLPSVLAYIVEEDASTARIGREGERIAEPIGPGLAARARHPHERIVSRD